MPLVAPARPFLDWTVETDPARWTPVPAAILGVTVSEPYSGEAQPNDQASGPDAIRGQSTQFWDGADHWDFHIGGPLGALLPNGGRDGGNLVLGDDGFGPYFETSVAALAHQFRTAKLSLILGGDHGVTIPALHALEAVGRPVHVVQIDAHLDWRDEVRGARLGYSSPMRRASELPWISGMTQIGLRATGSARAGEVEAATRWGAQLFTADAVHEHGLAPVLAALEGKGPFYLTVDLDGFDPSVVPGVAGPAPGGLRFEQVLPILKTLARIGPLVGLDIVELAPSFDLPNRISAITAGRLAVIAIGAALEAS